MDAPRWRRPQPIRNAYDRASRVRCDSGKFFQRSTFRIPPERKACPVQGVAPIVSMICQHCSEWKDSMCVAIICSAGPPVARAGTHIAPKRCRKDYGFPLGRHIAPASTRIAIETALLEPHRNVSFFWVAKGDSSSAASQLDWPGTVVSIPAPDDRRRKEVALHNSVRVRRELW